MEKALLIIILILAILGLMYFLYVTGILVTQSKKAVFYSEFNRGRQAKFRACTGSTQRVIVFDHKGVNEIELLADLIEGSVSLEITDKQKNVLLRLNGEDSFGGINVEPGHRYIMNIIFQNATGEYRVEVK